MKEILKFYSQYYNELPVAFSTFFRSNYKD